MADIETSVAITAQTDTFQSGLEAAAGAVGAATAAMKSELTDLGITAQRVQDQISATATAVESSINTIQLRSAELAASVEKMDAFGTFTDGLGQFPGLTVTQHSGLDVDNGRTLDRQWELEQDFYQNRLAAATDYAQAQQQINEEQKLAYQRYLGDKEKLDAQAIRSSQRQWESAVNPIQRALDMSITGLIVGTTTAQRALSNLAQSVVGGFVNSAVRSALGSLGAEILGAGISSGGRDLWAGASDVAETATGGGILGWLFRGIGSLFTFERGGIMPSAAGGWIVPSTSLAMLHANEMVLPASISQGIQTMIADGGNTGPHLTFAVSAIDSQSVASFFKNNGATLVAAINQAMRNGSALRSA